MRLYDVSVGAEMGNGEEGVVSLSQSGLSHHSQSGWGEQTERRTPSFKRGGGSRHFAALHQTDLEVWIFL